MELQLSGAHISTSQSPVHSACLSLPISSLNGPQSLTPGLAPGPLSTAHLRPLAFPRAHPPGAPSSALAYSAAQDTQAHARTGAVELQSLRSMPALSRASTDGPQSYARTIPPSTTRRLPPMDSRRDGHMDSAMDRAVSGAALVGSL